MTERPARKPSPNAAAAAVVVRRRLGRRRRRARGGIRDRRVRSAMRRDAACRPAVETGPAARAARARRGRGRGGRRASRCGCPTSPSATRPAARARSPTGAAAPCCSTCGRPGACRAARRCRRSTRCRPSSAAPNFEVVAVNIDTRDPDKPKTWLKEVGIDRLAYYADPSAKVFQDLKAVGTAFGMPTTLLVDPRRLRDRHPRGPGRMGERRRRQARERGARAIAERVVRDNRLRYPELMAGALSR